MRDGGRAQFNTLVRHHPSLTRAQLAHARSAAAVPAAATMVPRPQSLHATHDRWSVWFWNRPFAHGAHARFVVAVHAVVWYEPVSHVRQAVQPRFDPRTHAVVS